MKSIRIVYVRPLVPANESRYSQADVDDIEVDENSPPEHLWNEIAPSAEESRLHSLQEGSKTLTEFSQEDLQANLGILKISGSGSTGLSMRFEGSANKQEIPADEYRRLLRQLKAKQKDIVMHHHSWCKKAVIALKQGQSVKPYRVFLSGPGGVGNPMS